MAPWQQKPMAFPSPLGPVLMRFFYFFNFFEHTCRRRRGCISVCTRGPSRQAALIHQKKSMHHFITSTDRGLNCNAVVYLDILAQLSNHFITFSQFKFIFMVFVAWNLGCKCCSSAAITRTWEDKRLLHKNAPAIRSRCQGIPSSISECNNRA